MTSSTVTEKAQYASPLIHRILDHFNLDYL